MGDQSSGGRPRLETPDDLIRRYYECGYTIRQIASMTGLSKSTVAARLKAMGVEMRVMWPNRVRE